ncbi:hypothetical protein OG782_20970 [Streptomyces sp. NBC_00876]|uniref:hypothetical protein n=1 Tax=Streptomyces sp. NBC_00876 TaxID=2975853 RepID=UPI00386A2FA9|nr:hypothetical protein OG782_20970 [Streptomyces sp. NBC_00876]
MTSWMYDSFGHHEVNLVFARGLSLEAFISGLRDQHREPLAHGEAGGWVWAVHDMIDDETDDYDGVHYGRLCPEGTEVAVFVTEPCSAKAHGPQFQYLRDGRTVLFFSFEDIGQRVGENPDLISAELLAANLIGPGAECEQEETDDHDCFDHHYDDEDRLVRAIADAFALPSPPLALPSPPLAPAVTAK